ncbi:MAG: hypothetical protein V1933_05045 [Candidatus Omnitrophota bacterium]
MHKEDAKITCPVFQTGERIIKDFTDKINQAKGIQEKAKFAEELLKEAGALLSCPDFKGENLDCKNCRFIAKLRKKTANLIIGAKKLART